MRLTSLLSLSLLALFFLSCEKFEFTEKADTYYHLKVNDAIIPVWVKGNTQSKKFVVFVNGGPGLTSLDVAHMDLLGWEDSLENEVAMVYYDQRGNGNAQGRIPQKTLTLRHYLADLKAVIQSIHAQYDGVQVFLMGHSFGGLIGQSFLLEEANSNLVSGWINIAGSTLVDNQLEWQYRLEFLKGIAQDQMINDSIKWSSALAWAENNNPIETKSQKKEWRAFLGHAGEGLIPTDDLNISVKDFLGVTFHSSYNVFPAYLSTNSSWVSYKLFTDTKGTNLLPHLHHIKIPVLTIWGKYDDVIPPQLGLDGFNALGTAPTKKEFLLFEESGHQPFVNQPHLFEKEVVAFVKSI